MVDFSRHANIKWKKENEDLIDMHFSIYPTFDDETVDKEKFAKNLITMMRCSANGEYGRYYTK